VEVTNAALGFMENSVKSDKPFFLWWNSTRMHIWTHLKPESEGKTGLGVYADGMVEHDAMVGQLLDKLEELGVDENTIVMYSTDNGAEVFTWPDGGSTIFRNEKATQWEGGFRVPTVIRWPGVIEPGTIINDIGAHEDMFATLVAAAGNPNIKDELLNGKTIGGMNYKVHLDSYNLLPAFKGEGEWPRHEFLYWTDDGSCAALRYNNWKFTFLRQDHDGMDVWIKPYTTLRAPMVANLRMDPFEIAWDETIGYGQWWVDHMYVFAPAGAYIGMWLQSFKDFPPRQKPGSFSLDRVMESITQAAGDK
jgi:arylsulfatase